VLRKWLRLHAYKIQLTHEFEVTDYPKCVEWHDIQFWTLLHIFEKKIPEFSSIFKEILNFESLNIFFDNPVLWVKDLLSKFSVC
jgi:hypothetical protein